MENHAIIIFKALEVNGKAIAYIVDVIKEDLQGFSKDVDGKTVLAKNLPDNIVSGAFYKLDTNQIMSLPIKD